MSAGGFRELGPWRPGMGRPGPLQPVSGSRPPGAETSREIRTQWGVRDRGREMQGDRDTHVQRDCQRKAKFKMGNSVAWRYQESWGQSVRPGGRDKKKKKKKPKCRD